MTVCKKNWDNYQMELIERIFQYKWDLLEWLTGYGPTIPTMIVFYVKSQASNDCSVHEAGCPAWSLAYGGILKK